MKNELTEIIKLLQNTSSTKEKEVILKQHSDNIELQELLQLTYCPSVTCGVGAKTYPTTDTAGKLEDVGAIFHVVYLLDARQRTGHAAIDTLKELQSDLSPEYAELLRYVVLKDARINVGAKTINKVWKNLIVDIPYQRCSLLDEKVIERIEKTDRVLVQLKADGVFAVLTPQGMFTRNGSKFPELFVNNFSKIRNSAVCYEGEVVWYSDDSDKPLTREVSNGLTNSVVQGGEIGSSYYPVFMIWNALPVPDWQNGECDIAYKNRFARVVADVRNANSHNVRVIPTTKVSGIQQVMSINSNYLKDGYEGVIVKFPDSGWKYNTSKDCIKVKVEVEVDMRIISVEEATGKNAGMVGRINVESSDGKVWCGVNATGPASERKKFWNNRNEMVAQVITCKANDLLESDSKEGYSLFLGRADVRDVRTDKVDCDDLQRILEIFKSAGVVKNFGG